MIKLIYVLYSHYSVFDKNFRILMTLLWYIHLLYLTNHIRPVFDFQTDA